jgi:hypothetical protein
LVFLLAGQLGPGFEQFAMWFVFRMSNGQFRMPNCGGTIWLILKDTVGFRLSCLLFVPAHIEVPCI